MASFWDTLSGAAVSAARAMGFGESTATQEKNKPSVGIGQKQIEGFPAAPTGTYDTYDWMDRHPTVALVRAIVLSPIIRNEWFIEAESACPPDARQLATEFVREHRFNLISNFLAPGMSYGWSPGEIVWRKNGYWSEIDRIKRLEPRITKPLVDPGGNLGGIINKPESAENVQLLVSDAKCFVWTFDGQEPNYYGRSRHENIREAAWWQHIQVAMKLGQYLAKVAGLIVQMHYPLGSSNDVNGASRPNDWVAQSTLDAVSQGRSVRFPNLWASVDPESIKGDPQALLQASALAGKSSWILSTLEAGHADHARGLIESLMHLEAAIFQGWCRPARSGLESMHGSRADAGQHTDTGMLDSEMIELSFVETVNKQLLAPLLIANFGPKAASFCRIAANALVDQSISTQADMVKQAIASSVLATTLNSLIDWNQALDNIGVPRVNEPLPTQPDVLQPYG